VAQYVAEYHKTFKDNLVCLVSENNEDPAFDKLDYVNRIIIDDMYENPIDWKEFENCLVIFDDIDSIKGKLGKTIDDLRDKLLKNSRKFRVFVISTNIMEEAYEAVIQVVESKGADCIVIDSLPALVPGAEDEKHMEEFTVGRGALITNKFFRKVASATKRDLIESERPVLGIMINQYRMKIGVMHGDPRTTPGGLGKDYAYSVRCEVKRDEWVEVGTGESKRRVGQTIRVRTIKNKTFPPQQTAYLDFYFADGGAIDAGGYDTGKEIVALSILNGIVERRGGWMYYGDRKWQGAQALIDSLREEIELREELSKAVMSTIKAQPILALDEE
jgi:recombination protein RecA